MEQKEIEPKKKLEFSKIVVVATNIVMFAVTIYSAIFTFITRDSTPLAYLIPAIFTFATTTNASYMWKAKNENQLKIPYYMDNNYNDTEHFESEEENYNEYGNH